MSKPTCEGSQASRGDTSKEFRRTCACRRSISSSSWLSCDACSFQGEYTNARPSIKRRPATTNLGSAAAAKTYFPVDLFILVAIGVIIPHHGTHHSEQSRAAAGYGAPGRFQIGRKSRVDLLVAHADRGGCVASIGGRPNRHTPSPAARRHVRRHTPPSNTHNFPAADPNAATHAAGQGQGRAGRRGVATADGRTPV